ncbi:MAG TPA: hemerythrin domain-containing protein [Alphaproteobacteria bacterium]|nr:hemerythrin domain-containing protein [Alphaproteobacteria bacterium]
MYRNVHKGQRALLFELAMELGRTDFSEAAASSAIERQLRSAAEELRKHADNEEKYIHPLLHSRAPEIAAALEREHHAIEAALSDLDGRLRPRGLPEEEPATRGAELYMVWCRMLSAYLAHLDAEETLAMPALWRTCSDQEIFAVIQAFVASRSVADQLHDLRNQAPALTRQERATYVGNVMRGGALPNEQIWDSLAGVLPPDDLARLKTDISQGERPRADRTARIST